MVAISCSGPPAEGRAARRSYVQQVHATAVSGAVDLSVFPVFPAESLVALRDRIPYWLGLISSSDSYLIALPESPESERPNAEPGPSTQATGRPRAVRGAAIWSRINDA